jgi:signal transduction histidine kinase
LLVAAVGFVLTRFTVALAVYEDPVRFYLAGVVPMTLGLGLAAFGVALTVADVDRSLVRTTALWCVAGAGAMLVLVVLTLLGSSTEGMPAFETLRSRTYLSNFLIGGSVGGTLTGLYASRNRRQRGHLRQQANRLAVLNRMLRHEILNAVTAIRGYAALRERSDRDAAQVIESRSDAIEDTIEEVKYLTETTGTGDTVVGPTDVEDCLETSLSVVTERYPDATITTTMDADGAQVLANSRLERVFVHLLENAIVHSESETPTVEVTVTVTANEVLIDVTDDGPGLPSDQQTLLETGDIESFDDPGTGFGLNVVRLLVESYRGRVETDVDASGTTVRIALPRARDDAGGAWRPTGSVRPALPQLGVILVASLVAGVLFSAGSGLFGGSVGIIGVLYGVQSTVVGWITHEFHSVVFGFAFATLLSLAPARYQRGPLVYLTYAAIGLGWGLVLWFVASGFVSAFWFRLVGVPASIPNLTLTSFVGHVVWGVSLGLLTAVGYRRVTPWLGRRLGRDG